MSETETITPPADADAAPVPAGELVAFGLAMERAQQALAALQAENEHLKSALAGDNEGVRLWMLDCARLVNRHRERGDTAEAKVAEYENAITWNTSCTSCAAVLDSSIAETFRREQAEARCDRIREVISNFLSQYGSSQIPMFKVGQDLATRTLKILDTCGQCDGGLIEVGHCNCGGGGPDGYPAHEPLCGAEPCPNGCWDRLHPPVERP